MGRQAFPTAKRNELGVDAQGGGVADVAITTVSANGKCLVKLTPNMFIRLF